jgi:hypothetical protein
LNFQGIRKKWSPDYCVGRKFKGRVRNEEGKKIDFCCLKIKVNNFLKKGGSHKIGKKTQSRAAFFFVAIKK